MNFLTRDILKFYKFNKKQDSDLAYLIKNFSNNNMFGSHEPGDTEPFMKKLDKEYFFVGTVDEHTDYKINEFGLRGEIYKDADVIASGCSITFGIGVPEEARWSNFLSNKINKKVINLGNPGASVETICRTIIQYSLNNKMPKEVFCFFPDFFRSIVVIDKEFYQTKKKEISTVEDNHLWLTFCNPTVNKYKNSIFMEVKDKKYIEDSTSPHQLILNAINSIYLLESFCLTNNIKLNWTTWDFNTALIMEELIKIPDFKLKNFKQFFPSDGDQMVESFVWNCPLSHGSKFKDNPWWVKGADYSIINYKKITEYSHPGIHFHEHIADFFDKIYKKDVKSV